jgi:beta-phosphoglucomutase
MVQPMTGIRAVIFDVDGVLIDSYAAHLQSWLDLAAESGTEFTERDFAATFGRTSRDILRHYWPARDDAEVRALDDRKEAIFRDLIRADFPAMDGAVELIDRLVSAAFALAVGSSGPPENVELVLYRLGRRSAFTAVITGKDVTRGKPDPQVFLLAAERLGVETGRCTVIEDAPAGIIAARAAGMRAIALTSTGRAVRDFDQAQPDVIVRSLREVEAILLGNE